MRKELRKELRKEFKKLVKYTQELSDEDNDNYDGIHYNSNIKLSFLLIIQYLVY
jgi:hypothetical protein